MTGYQYFGARYYNSDISVWLSVDPMSDKYPSLSPYNYCAGNPVMLVDPDGMDIDPTFEGDIEEEKNANKEEYINQVNNVTGGDYDVIDGKLEAIDGNYGTGINADLFKEGITSDNSIPMNIVNNDDDVFFDSYLTTDVDVGDLGKAGSVVQKGIYAHFLSERIAAGEGYSDYNQRLKDITSFNNFAGFKNNNFGRYHNVGLRYETRAIEEALSLVPRSLIIRLESNLDHKNPYTGSLVDDGYRFTYCGRNNSNDTYSFDINTPQRNYFIRRYENTVKTSIESITTNR